MSSRRTLILVAAVVVGLLSAFLVFNYVNGADERAQGDVEQVPILKLTTDVSAGTSAAVVTESIEQVEVPKKDKVASAITDKSRIAGKVAAFDIPANSQLIEGMFVDPVLSTTSNAGRIPSDCGGGQQCVAISLQFDAVHAVSGLISPGDRVNMLVVPIKGDADSDLCSIYDNKAAFDALSDAARQALFQFNPGAPVESLACTPAHYLYQAVKVLFVDKTSVSSGGADASSSAAPAATTDTGLITFAVPPSSAAVLASFAKTELYLSLLPDNYVATPVPGFDPTMPLLPGQDASQITPYGPSGFPDN